MPHAAGSTRAPRPLFTLAQRPASRQRTPSGRVIHFDGDGEEPVPVVPAGPDSIAIQLAAQDRPLPCGHACLLELDPLCNDAMVPWWEQFTGRKAKRDTRWRCRIRGSGRTHCP